MLLHDVGCSADDWWRVGPGLAAQGWDVIAPDLVAHGSRSALQRPLDMPTLIDGLVYQLPGQADLLLGHGFGAVVALTLTGRYFDVARALVLEDPPVGTVPSRDAMIRRVLLESAFARADTRGLAERMAEANPTWSPTDVEVTVKALSDADVPAIVAGLRGRISWDLAGLVAEVRRPLLVLAAPEDPQGFGSDLYGPDREDLSAMLPPGQFVELPGGHFLHRDKPREWRAVVTGFTAACLGLEETPPQPGADADQLGCPQVKPR